MKERINHCFRLVLLFTLGNFFSVAAISQNLDLKGNVKDDKGTPLNSVNITIQGSNLGTTTDNEGNFSLGNLKPGSLLVFTHAGYQRQEIKVVKDTYLSIFLLTDNQSLGDVVVIGYGTVAKKEVTNAVAHLTPGDLNKGAINNPAQLLQGKVAGLSIVAPQGNPNGNYNIRLRGLSTLGASSQPLIIVDGIIGVDLNSIDPNDIASIDVLKDGGAAAIYGTRGSSGVILITTKSGAKGKTRVEYNGYVSSEMKNRYLPVMNSQTYLANGGTDYGSNIDWLNEITRNAISHTHNLALSGGTDKTKYMASVNYRNVEGILKNTGFQQLGARLNLSQKALNDRLTLLFNLSLQSRDAALGFEDAFRAAVAMPPTAPIHSPDPAYSKYGGYFQSEVHELYNPVGIIQQNINNQVTSRLMYNLKADYEVIKNLVGSVRFARNNDNITNGQYISKYSYYASGVDRNGLASRGNNNSKSNLFEVTGNYSKSLRGLTMNFLAGYSYQDFTSENFFTQAGNFLTDAFGYNNFAAAKDFADGKAIATSVKENNKLAAFFGRASFAYNNTYFLSASLRKEGSSRFGAGNKWGLFPGVSLAADLSRILDLSNIDLLKLRGSYGVTGALPGQSYLSQQLYGPGSSPTYFLYNGVFTPVYSPQSNPNPDLKWETKSEIDFGVDFSAFDSRLNGTVDFYSRNTKDALITLNVPVPPNLFPTTVLNAGKLKNTGIEVSLDYHVIKTNHFNWNTKATFSTYNTKVVSLSMGDIKYGVREVGGLPAPLTGNTVRVEEGKPIGQMFGWIYEGVGADGKYIIRDIDKNNTIDEKDMTIIGRGLPKGEWGWSNTLNYKRFDLNIFFRGVYGHDLVNLNRTMFEQVSRISSYNLVNTKYFDPNYTGPAAYNSYYLEHASFAKLEYLSLGYNFKTPANGAISNLRLFISGQNLFYITKYTGVDPEPRYTDNDGNVLAPGVEPRNSWLTTKTFTLGFNVSF